MTENPAAAAFAMPVATSPQGDAGQRRVDTQVRRASVAPITDQRATGNASTDDASPAAGADHSARGAQLTRVRATSSRRKTGARGHGSSATQGLTAASDTMDQAPPRRHPRQPRLILTAEAR